MPRATENRCAQRRPRRNVVDEDNVGVYHVWVRCVRRAWLCGADPLTGHDWTHRKQWFFERLEELTRIFAVDACVWAILACSIYIDLTEIRAELAATPEDSPNTSAYRRILARLLRKARAEADGPSAKSQAAAYQPGDPDYWMCPVNERDRAPLLGPQADRPHDAEQAALLGQGETSACPALKRWRHGFLPISVDQYLELLDWTGRQLVASKRGAINETHPPILERLGLQPSVWLEMMQKFDVWFHGAVGSAEALAKHAVRTGQRWIQGARRCRDAFT